MNYFGDQWLMETIVAALIGAGVQVVIAVITYLGKMNDISKKIDDLNRRFDSLDKQSDVNAASLSEDHNNILGKVEDLWKEESGKKVRLEMMSQNLRDTVSGLQSAEKIILDYQDKMEELRRENVRLKERLEHKDFRSGHDDYER